MALVQRIYRTGTGDARAGSPGRAGTVRPLQFQATRQLGDDPDVQNIVLLETDVDDGDTAAAKYQQLPSTITYGLEPKENQVFQLTGTAPNKTWELMAA